MNDTPSVVGLTFLAGEARYVQEVSRLDEHSQRKTVDGDKLFNCEMAHLRATENT